MSDRRSSDRRRGDHARITEARLARLSVLQELTVSALDLFDPQSSVDPFLQRIAERLGSLAVLWIAITPAGVVTLVGAAGLSEASRALPIVHHPDPSLDSLVLPYPELARVGMTRWHFRLEPSAEMRTGRSHALALWFDAELSPPDDLRPTLERLAGVLHTVWTHRQLTVDLRQSNADVARAQRALVDQARLAAIGEMAAVVAHEVRNPLAVIFTAVGGLQKLPAGSEDASVLLGILGDEARRLEDLVAGLLDFARPAEITLAGGSLEEVVRGAIRAAQAAEPALGRGLIQLNLVVSGTLPPAMLDGRLVHRAMINLISNAVHAMPSGGNIVVRLAEDVLGDRPALRVEVEDDGPGISPDHLKRIFEPFFTTRATGTGLGLSIVKRIAEAHQGELTVRSEGRGSTFVMRLPR